MKLTAKQKLFCDAYLIDLNATKAAISAGYSEKTAQVIGAENLKKPIVAEYIQKRMDKRAKRTEITQDYVLKTIKETIEQCSEAETYTPAAVLKGCELLGKHLKMFTEKVEHTGEVTHNHKAQDDMDFAGIRKQREERAVH